MSESIDILAIGVHPDDVELSCSGTLLHHISLGRTVGILDLTKGELGTRGNAKLRSVEAEQAAEILGVTFRAQADLPDGLFDRSTEYMLKIIPFIRAYQPKIVLANAIRDRHPDHGRSAGLVADACFYSGLVKIKTHWKGDEQKAWRPQALYHYIQDDHHTPDFVVNISAFIDQKLQAIKAFKSQFYSEESQEPLTPISQKNFLDAVLAKNAVFGRSIGVNYAEGFICSRIPGVHDIFNLI